MEMRFYLVQYVLNLSEFSLYNNTSICDILFVMMSKAIWEWQENLILFRGHSKRFPGIPSGKIPGSIPTLLICRGPMNSVARSNMRNNSSTLFEIEIPSFADNKSFSLLFWSHFAKILFIFYFLVKIPSLRFNRKL